MRPPIGIEHSPNCNMHPEMVELLNKHTTLGAPAKQYCWCGALDETEAEPRSGASQLLSEHTAQAYADLVGEVVAVVFELEDEIARETQPHKQVLKLITARLRTAIEGKR